MFARINIYICTAAPFVLFLPRVMSSPAKVGLHAPLMYHTPCAAALNSYAVALLLTTPRDKTPTWGVGVFLVRRPNYGGAKHGKFGAARYGRSSRDDNFFFPAPSVGRDARSNKVNVPLGPPRDETAALPPVIIRTTTARKCEKGVQQRVLQGC